jgi:hypothetical protein
MKRDLTLSKKILAFVEVEPPAPYVMNVVIDGYTKQEINYHLQLLEDAGYVLCHHTSNGHKPKRLTNSGHDFLEASRNEGVWNRMIKTGKDKGVDLSLSLAKELLISYSKELLGLQ